MSEAEILPRGIRMHKSGKFIVDVSVKNTRFTKIADTLDDAIIVRAELEQDLHQEKSQQRKTASKQVPTGGKKRCTRPESWTLEQAYKRTLPLYWAGKGGEKTSTINAQASLDYFGNTTLVEDIGPEWIADFVEHLMGLGNAGGTINRKLSCLSRMLRTAYDFNKLDRLPKMPRRREGEHRIRFLSPEEEEQVLSFLDHAGYPNHKEAVLMLIYTGFRCGELWRLECRDIDLEHGTITAWKTKNGHPRTIPIVETIRPIIERRMEMLGRSGLLFPGSSKKWLRHVWARVRRHMKAEDDLQFVPHMLRHTCATRLAQKGVTMTIIKEWMGHSNIQTTGRYTHFAPKDLRNAAALLGCS